MSARKNARGRGPLPTQVMHPARTMIRTGFQVAIALATLIPYVVMEVDIPVAGWFAQVVAAAILITRIMALPGVTTFIRQFLPWLAPDDGAPAPARYGEGLRGEAKAHDDMTGS